MTFVCNNCGSFNKSINLNNNKEYKCVFCLICESTNVYEKEATRDAGPSVQYKWCPKRCGKLESECQVHVEGRKHYEEYNNLRHRWDTFNNPQSQSVRYQ